MSALLLVAGGAWAGDTVVVATCELGAGDEITAKDVALQDISATGFRPAGDALRALDSAIGSSIGPGRILAGEVVRRSRLLDPEAPHQLSLLIPRGMRAMRIPTADVDSVEMGAYVDLLGAGCTWAQALFVLGSPGDGFPEFQTPPDTLVVLVTPDQAERLAWATRAGPVYAGVRSRQDVAERAVQKCPYPKAR